jgi:hypothetical protein
MNKGGYDGGWKQSRDPTKEWWAQLTSDSMETVITQRNKFIRLIQEKFGYTRRNAEQEFDQRLAEYQASHKTSIYPMR